MIRRATVDDAPWFVSQIPEYLKEAQDGLRFSEIYAARQVEAVLAAPNVAAFIAPCEGHIVSVFTPSLYHPDDIFCRVSTIWIVPESRGSGRARELLRAVENEAKARGAHRVLIDTHERMRDAGPWYVRRGYRQVQRLYEKWV